MGARDTIGMIPNFGCKLAANFKTKLMKLEETNKNFREMDFELILIKLDNLTNLIETQAGSRNLEVRKNTLLSTDQAAYYLGVQYSPFLGQL
jgi:ABC-type Zn uptake system ZnuABC Zn-binding protein ZnuA